MGEQEMPIRVMVVDDHPLVRDGLKMLLYTAPDMALAAEAGSGEEALRFCKALAIDIILMDLKMPGMGGIEATRAIHDCCPEVKVIALTSYVDKGMVEEALQAGAISYILKNTSPAELAAAIRSAYEGQATISTAAAQSLVRDGAASRYSPGDDLTSREREVLALMALGLSNNAIGHRLAIQPATVNFHVGNILSKLEVSNRTEAVALAVHLGLV